MISVKGYRILKKPGSGGMAMVYFAEHEKLSHSVAIKVLIDSVDRIPKALTRPQPE